MGQRWRESFGKIIHSDSCGCATSAIFLGIALVLTGTWYGWHWQTSMLSPGTTAAHILGLSFAASAVGKLTGLYFSNKRSRSRKQIVAQAPTPPKTSQLNVVQQDASTDAAKLRG